MALDLGKLGDVFIDIRARFDKFGRDLDTAERRANTAGSKISRQFDRMRGSALGVVTAIGAMRAGLISLGATVIIGGLSALIKKSLEAAEAIGDVAIKAAVSVETLQGLRFAGLQSGLAFRDVDDSLTRLNRRIGLFTTQGGGPAAVALRDLGLESRILSGELQSNEDRFFAAIDALGQYQDAAEQSALASQLFGEDAGPRMAQLIARGTAGIKELMAAAEELGIILKQETIDKATEANQKLKTLSAILGSQLVNAVAQLAPQIEALAEDIIQSLPDLIAWVNEWARWFGFIDTSDVAALEMRLAEVNAEIAATKEQLKFEGVGGALRDLADQLLSTFNVSTLKEDLAGLEAEAISLVEAIEQARARAQARALAELTAGGDPITRGPTDATKKELSDAVEAAIDAEKQITSASQAAFRSLVLSQVEQIQFRMAEDIIASKLAADAAIDALQAASDQGVLTHDEFEKQKTAITDREANRRALIEQTAAIEIEQAQDNFILKIESAFADVEEFAIQSAINRRDAWLEQLNQMVLDEAEAARLRKLIIEGTAAEIRDIQDQLNEDLRLARELSEIFSRTTAQGLRDVLIEGRSLEEVFGRLTDRLTDLAFGIIEEQLLGPAFDSLFEGLLGGGREQAPVPVRIVGAGGIGTTDGLGSLAGLGRAGGKRGGGLTQEAGNEALAEASGGFFSFLQSGFTGIFDFIGGGFSTIFSGLGNLLGSIFGGGAGAGGGVGGLLGIVTAFLGFKRGGRVPYDGTPVQFFGGGGMVSGVGGGVVPAAIFRGAPRFRSGTIDSGAISLGADEFPAILHRGEEVLTAAQVRESGGPGGRGVTQNITFNLPDETTARGFQRSSRQAAGLAGRALSRASRDS